MNSSGRVECTLDEAEKVADSFPTRRGNWALPDGQRVTDEDQLELLQRIEADETVSKLAAEVAIRRQPLHE
ncbi:MULTISPECIES: hypothetical protein [unclassified Mesorhizobium]|uniref:hypothetical protein n=1 Tax=unclassified Mesorhizobium TaxID=325217 RepID=UPI003337F6BA